MTVLIVGGSLCGLTLALACAKHGIPTRVLERAPDVQRLGATLSINRRRLLETVGIADHDPRASTFPSPVGDRLAVSWHTLHSWLLQRAAERAEIVIENNVTVTGVCGGSDLATATTSTGRLLTAPLIVGADGQCSIVRRAVDPVHPAALYAGYILWRGLVAEASLPGGTDLSRLGESISLVTREGHRLVAFAVADDAGSVQVGGRLISFVWYDPGHFGMLRKLDCIDALGNVRRLPRPGDVAPRTVGELRDLAGRQWPEPWRTVILHAIASGRMFPFTVAEYYPRRLHSGRIALIGDAAHVASPVTAQGFATGIEDAAVLAALLAKTLVDAYSDALKSFERARLTAAQALVASSMAWSAKFITNPVRASSEASGGLYPLARGTA